MKNTSQFHNYDITPGVKLKYKTDDRKNTFGIAIDGCNMGYDENIKYIPPNDNYYNQQLYDNCTTDKEIPQLLLSHYKSSKKPTQPIFECELETDKICSCNCKLGRNCMDCLKCKGNCKNCMLNILGCALNNCCCCLYQPLKTPPTLKQGSLLNNFFSKSPVVQQEKIKDQSTGEIIADILCDTIGTGFGHLAKWGGNLLVNGEAKAIEEQKKKCIAIVPIQNSIVTIDQISLEQDESWPTTINKFIDCLVKLINVKPNNNDKENCTPQYIQNMSNYVLDLISKPSSIAKNEFVICSNPPAKGIVCHKCAIGENCTSQIVYDQLKENYRVEPSIINSLRCIINCSKYKCKYGFANCYYNNKLHLNNYYDLVGKTPNSFIDRILGRSKHSISYKEKLGELLLPELYNRQALYCQHCYRNIYTGRRRTILKNPLKLNNLSYNLYSLDPNDHCDIDLENIFNVRMQHVPSISPNYNTYHHTLNH